MIAESFQSDNFCDLSGKHRYTQLVVQNVNGDTPAGEAAGDFQARMVVADNDRAN